MTIPIRQLAPTFAAEVRGVDLRHLPSQEKLDEIYDAFLKYRVLFLPGQALSIEQHLQFGRLLIIWPDTVLGADAASKFSDQKRIDRIAKR